MRRNPLLSICITTRDRGDVIGETLQSIIEQMDNRTEIVIFDGASSDNTEQTVRSYQKQNPRSIHYYKETINSGLDAGFDQAVKHASGKYCWLMSDDDILREDALASIHSKLVNAKTMYFVETEVRDYTLENILNTREETIGKPVLTFDIGNIQQFLAEYGGRLSYIGSVIIDRHFWLGTDREKYYGSMFIHMGVILEHSRCITVGVISEPWIIIRAGNATWSTRWFEMWMFMWPELIWSFDHIPESVKLQITPRYPWKSFKKILFCVGVGSYSSDHYARFFAKQPISYTKIMLKICSKLPYRIVNILLIIYEKLITSFWKGSLENLYYFRTSNRCFDFLRIETGVSKRL